VTWEGTAVTDYDKLAKKLKGTKSGDPAGNKPASYGFDPATFYQYVKQQVEEEVDKANLELRKRDLPVIERIFMPSSQGKLSLTFGTGFLCNVELNQARGRITALIIGPPNSAEIARKDFLLNPEAGPQELAIGDAEEALVVYSPHRIAAEIVSGLLAGEFA
jgi:hypothetical protein